MKDSLEVLDRFAHRWGYGVSVTSEGQVTIYSATSFEAVAISGRFGKEEILMAATLLLEEAIDMQAGQEEEKEMGE